ncbi:MAG: ImmA/IrrE family metallo-endopeptidase [Thermoanaerobaculia bacterium]
MFDARQRQNDWREPADLIRHLGIDDPAEIDVEAIAEFCGATVVYDRLGGSEGRLVSLRDHAVITVEKSSHPFRRRFSAAHELCHWMFDRGEQNLDFDRPRFHVWPGGNPEKRANRWAADLLMPTSLFVPDAEGREMTFATVRELARRYRTSLTATAFRLIEHGSFPAMLVCSRRGEHWPWFKRGTHLIRGIYPVPEPDAGSVAFELLRGLRDEPGSVEVEAKAWITRPDSWWFTLREDSVRTGNGDVLSLLWWTNLSQLEFASIPAAVWLPWTPGKGAVRRFTKTLRDKWGWRRVRGAAGEVTLETDQPSFARIVLPDAKAQDEAGFRSVVAEVARHHGVTSHEILASMVVEIEKEVEARKVKWEREHTEQAARMDATQR